MFDREILSMLKSITKELGLVEVPCNHNGLAEAYQCEVCYGSFKTYKKHPCTCTNPRPYKKGPISPAFKSSCGHIGRNVQGCAYGFYCMCGETSYCSDCGERLNDECVVKTRGFDEDKKWIN
jgi:hypothetical protein